MFPIIERYTGIHYEYKGKSYRVFSTAIGRTYIKIGFGARKYVEVLC